MSLLRRPEETKFEDDARRQFDTMDRHLAGREWFAEDYSIADIIPFTRIHGIKHDRVRVSNYSNVAKWLDRVGARPAVKKAMQQKFG